MYLPHAVRSRSTSAALAAVALALSSCGGGGGGGDVGSALLQASCAVDTAGRVPFLTVLARATPPAGTTFAPTTGTISVTTSAAGTITGPIALGANAMGLGEVSGAGLVRGVRATVTATVAGQPATTTCVAGPGLPAVTPAASAAGGAITVTWPAVAGAVAYRVSVLDGDTGLPAQVQQVAASPATFTTTLDVRNLPEIRVAALSVTADAPIAGPLPVPSASHESFLLSSGTAAGGGAAWRVYRPQDFTGSTLTASFADLAAGEQLAVLLVNTAGSDSYVPTVTVSGTGAAPARLAAPLTARLALAPEAATDDPAARRAGIDRAHEAFRRWDRERLASLAADSPPGLAPAALAAAPVAPLTVNVDKRDFCHATLQANFSFQFSVQRATLRAVSAGGHAQFWVTDVIWPEFQATITDLPTFWQTLGDAYDGPIRTALAAGFGDQSDYDGNGQMLFVLADLGSVTTADGKAFVAGYFTSGDLRRANVVGSGACSNGADVLFLASPGIFVGGARTEAVVREVEYPGTMAHELQHNVNFNERCLKGRAMPGCSSGSAEEDWVNEGLSMVSEDAAGYGLAVDPDFSDSEFRRVGNYLRVYRDYSLTLWDSDTNGNYGGVHSFMRYWLDRLPPGSDFTRRVVTSGLSGRTGIEAVLGVPFETAMIRWAHALVFSGEAFSPLPGWDFPGGTNWSPLHQRLRSDVGVALEPFAYPAFTPLQLPGTATFPPLRADGWGLYFTGKGTGGPATVSVVTIAPAKPHVVLVRFSGDLPIGWR